MKSVYVMHLEAELLAPFHYFGVADQTVDYEQVDILNGHYEESSLVRALSTFTRELNLLLIK